MCKRCNNSFRLESEKTAFLRIWEKIRVYGILIPFLGCLLIALQTSELTTKSVDQLNWLIIIIGVIMIPIGWKIAGGWGVET